MAATRMAPLCKVDVHCPGFEGPRGCAMPVVSMSKKEFDRLEVLLGVQSGRLRVADPCELLVLKRRQVFRLLAGLKHGVAISRSQSVVAGRATIVCPRRIVIWR